MPLKDLCDQRHFLIFHGEECRALCCERCTTLIQLLQTFIVNAMHVVQGKG